MKNIRRFIESNREGQLSKLHAIGTVYHAARLDAEHIFGVVELDSEQAKIIDADEDITLLPAFAHRTLKDSKNPNVSKLHKHYLSLMKHGIVTTMSSDEVTEILQEKLGFPLLQ